MSVIDEALRLMSARLGEIEREARELRAAIAAIDNGRANSARSARSAPVRRYQARIVAPQRPAGRPRARRGENRSKVLATIQHQAKTAGEIAAETGINGDTTASTLLALVRTGQARKATRGYVAAG